MPLIHWCVRASSTLAASNDRRLLGFLKAIPDTDEVRITRRGDAQRGIHGERFGKELPGLSNSPADCSVASEVVRK